MKFRPLMLVVAMTSVTLLACSALAACFDWSTPSVGGVVDGGQADTSMSAETGVPADGGDAGQDAEDAALPSCGPPVTPPGPPLLHVELDDLASLSTPRAGSGVGSLTTAKAPDFAPGVCNTALHFEAGVRLSYPEALGADAGGAPNVSYAEGTIMLWYRPDYPDTDTNDHPLVRTTGLAVRGGVRLSRGKIRGVDFVLFDSAGVLDGKLEAPTTFAQGRWVHIAVTWKAGAAPRLFVNGVLAPTQNTLVVDSTPASPSSAQAIAIGNNTPTTADASAEPAADGLIDDLRFYPTALP